MLTELDKDGISASPSLAPINAHHSAETTHSWENRFQTRSLVAKQYSWQPVKMQICGSTHKFL